MIDPYHFSLAQKMTWVKLLFDNKFEHFWKTIELSEMDRQYGDMLWKSYAPESLLNRLQSTLLADSLRTWYIYRERACQEIYNTNFSDMGNQSLWYNRNIRSRTKHYFYYEDWCEKGILYIDDLLNPPLPGSKLFEELVLDFNISRQDRRKFNFLMKCIPSPWLEDSHSKDIDIFENITSGLLHTNKVPKFTYSLLNETCLPEKRIKFWENIFGTDAGDDTVDTDWEEIHLRNFKCCIDTRLRSFYFKVFHKAIAFNDFLFKINRKDSPICDLCKKFPESIIHVFCECECVDPIWKNLVKIIQDKHDIDFSITNFDKIFGIYKDDFLTYIFLCVKYHIYVCKFQNKKPNFTSLKVFIKGNRDTEYLIAKKRGKLSAHFKKWRFDF